MRLIAETFRILRAKFHCNRLTTVQDIQYYGSLIFGTHCRAIVTTADQYKESQAVYDLSIVW